MLFGVCRYSDGWIASSYFTGDGWRRDGKGSDIILLANAVRAFDMCNPSPEKGV